MNKNMFALSIVNEILEKIPKSKPHFLVVLGPNCAGKTVLTQNLCERAEDRVSIPIGSRHFILPKSLRLQKGLHGLEPESYELQRMQEFVSRLLDKKVTPLEFTGRKEGKYGLSEAYFFFPDKQVIILEGLPWIYSLSLIPKENRTVAVLLHNSLQSWFDRAKKRDIEERGYNLIEVKESILKRTLYLDNLKDEIETSTNIAILTSSNGFCKILEKNQVSSVIHSYYLEIVKGLDFILN